MALRAVADHPKLHHLKRLLMELGDRDKRAALGTLEYLWHFTGRFTPQGNVGKYEDEVIEEWIGWSGEPGKLIEALVASRWIDKDKEFRLLVHDWDEGCDEATKKAVHRKKNPDGTPRRLIGEMRKHPDGAPDPDMAPTRHSPIDPRFEEFKKLLLTWWGEVNNKPGELAAWGSGTTRALVDCLRAEPQLDRAELMNRLTYRYRSIEIAGQRKSPRPGDINATALLHEVIRELPRFANGPVNDFGDKI